MVYHPIGTLLFRALRIRIRLAPLEPIHRAFHPRWTSFEDMSIDHCRFNILVAQELMYYSNAILGFEQMRSEEADIVGVDESFYPTTICLFGLVTVMARSSGSAKFV